MIGLTVLCVALSFIGLFGTGVLIHILRAAQKNLSRTQKHAFNLQQEVIALTVAVAKREQRSTELRRANLALVDRLKRDRNARVNDRYLKNHAPTKSQEEFGEARRKDGKA